MLLGVDTAFADEVAEDGAEEGVEDAAELRGDEEGAALLVADATELADAPVPTGAFCRR